MALKTKRQMNNKILFAIDFYAFIIIVGMTFVVLTQLEILRKLSYSRFSVFQEIPLDTLTITFYTANPKENLGVEPVLTASGVPPFVGSVAISPDLKKKYNIKYNHDLLFIEGKGMFIINNLMAETKKQQVDVFVTSSKQAFELGKQRRKCWLVKPILLSND